MTRSQSKVKKFFAKGVTCGTQDTLTIVGFADDKLDSTQFLTIFRRKPKSSRKKANYVVQIDTDENEACDAIESYELNEGSFSATFSEQAAAELGFTSVMVEFEPVGKNAFLELKKVLNSIIQQL